jgi:hypothetical protein
MNDCDEIIAPPNQLFACPNSPPTDLKIKIYVLSKLSKALPNSLNIFKNVMKM